MVHIWKGCQCLWDLNWGKIKRHHEKHKKNKLLVALGIRADLDHHHFQIVVRPIFSPKHRLVDKIIFIFWPKISLAHLDLVHFIIRKLAHLSVYGILSLLWSWVFKPEAENWNTVWVTKVLFICLCAASLDETHQSLIQSRTGSPIDVIIDISGAGLAQVLWRTYFKKVKKITRGVN